MICNKCNRILSDDSKFCQYCGNKIASVKEETIAKYNTVNNVDADNATKNVSLEGESEHICANPTQELVDTYTQAHALYKTKKVEKIQCAIRLFKEIEDRVDVSTEIKNCTAKIEKIKKSQFAKIEKIKDIESQPVISQVANKAALIAGIPLVLVLLFWMVLSFSITLEIVRYWGRTASFIIRDYGLIFCCTVAQLITVGSIFTLLLVSKKRTNIFVSISRMLLAVLNLVMACLSLSIFESPKLFRQYLGWYYNICVKSSLLCYIANIILSVLLIILIILGAFRKKRYHLKNL